jgi:hypothetical protein
MNYENLNLCGYVRPGSFQFLGSVTAIAFNDCSVLLADDTDPGDAAVTNKE